MLERPSGYDEVPSWLPNWLHGAYKALDSPMMQMTPAHAGIRVLRTSGNPTQQRVLENSLGILRQKVRPLTDMISENFDARVRVSSPRLGAEGVANYRVADIPKTSSRVAPTKTPLLDVKIHPSEIFPGAESEVALYLLHEFLHPKVAKIPQGLLGRIAPKAMGRLQNPPKSMRDPDVVPNPAWYKGRDLLEELAVRMMEENIRKKRLGF